MIERSKYLMDVAAFAALLVAGLLTAQQQGCMPTPGPTPGPVDPVDPQPNPDPEPPKPAPIAGDVDKVLIVYESEDPLPVAQLNAIRSVEWKEKIGKDNWRVFDMGGEFEHEDPIWRDAMKRPGIHPPFLIYSDPDGGQHYEGPFPRDLDAFMELLNL